jgi:hypothetical protein
MNRKGGVDMKRLVVAAVGALVLSLCVPATASAYEWIYYSRNGSLINGSMNYNCSVSTCSSQIWRAGSGSGKTACEKNNWIPLGSYDVPFHDDNYNASLIKGRVWRLSDYQCSNGVRRTELFIHSEETSNNGQSCPTSDDDPFCWEGANDYYSNGCIKIARMPVTNGQSDLGRLDSWDHGRAGVIDWVNVSS